jgi:hypothetical protein
MILLERKSLIDSARCKGEAGSILILATIVILVLFAFMGLSLDASYMHYHKRSMQTAADAAAVSGANQILRAQSTDSVIASARDDAKRNGFQHGTNNIDVAVYRPPQNGARAGNPTFVEVIVSHRQPTWFMRAIGINDAQIKARAVAGPVGESSACVYALNRDSSSNNNGVFVNGSVNATVGCGVYSNSNFRSVGGGCLSAPEVSYVGTYNNGSCAEANSPSVPVVDPMLGRYTIPPYGSCNYNNFKVLAGQAAVLSPGVYCGGITATANSIASITFEPGLYYLVGGGMQINTAAPVTGVDVTFVNTYPVGLLQKYVGIAINGGANISLKAPTSGPYLGLLFYQDPTVIWTSSNASQMAGGGGSTYHGIIYMPTTDLIYSGGTTGGLNQTNGYTILLAYNIEMKGGTTIGSDYSTIGGSNPFRLAAFVE